LLKGRLLFIGCDISRGFSSERDFDNAPTQSLRGQKQSQQVILKLPPVVDFKSGFARLISQKYGNQELLSSNSTLLLSPLICSANSYILLHIELLQSWIKNG
jgi:hypothetical protein